jgi:hypothetical protein
MPCLHPASITHCILTGLPKGPDGPTGPLTDPIQSPPDMAQGHPSASLTRPTDPRTVCGPYTACAGAASAPVRSWPARPFLDPLPRGSETPPSAFVRPSKRAAPEGGVAARRQVAAAGIQQLRKSKEAQLAVKRFPTCPFPAPAPACALPRAPLASAPALRPCPALLPFPCTASLPRTESLPCLLASTPAPRPCLALRPPLACALAPSPLCPRLAACPFCTLGTWKGDGGRRGDAPNARV